MKANLSYTDLLDLIEDNGSRITGPRRDIVNLLISRKEGFTPEEINFFLSFDSSQKSILNCAQLKINSNLLDNCFNVSKKFDFFLY